MLNHLLMLAKSHLDVVHNSFYTLLVPFTNVLMRIFTHIFMRNIGLKFSFHVTFLSGFDFRGMLALQAVLKCILSTLSPERDCRELVEYIS